MQCPNCDHAAPQADFGDPLRCPDCGVYYQKALAHKQRKAGTAGGSNLPSVDPGGQSASERVFFERHGVKVTNARFIVSGQTYAMASVNSVKVAARDVTPSNAVALVMIVIAAFWFLMLFATKPHGLIAYALPIILGSAGLWWAKSIKSQLEYKIVLTTSSGETSALTSANEPDIRVVEQALNDAIVSRG